MCLAQPSVYPDYCCCNSTTTSIGLLLYWYPFLGFAQQWASLTWCKVLSQPNTLSEQQLSASSPSTHAYARMTYCITLQYAINDHLLQHWRRLLETKKKLSLPKIKSHPLHVITSWQPKYRIPFSYSSSTYTMANLRTPFSSSIPTTNNQKSAPQYPPPFVC